MAGKAVNRRALSARPAAWRKGWDDGYRSGSECGYHLGRCEAVMRKLPPSQLAWWDVRLLYITSGKGYPYSPLDDSIIVALRALVRQLDVMTPSEPYVEYAIQTKPDVVLVLDGLNIDTGHMDTIRSHGIRTAVWLTDDPYYTDLTLPLVLHFDTVFTLELSCVDFYRRHGSRDVHYLPFAANPAIFRPKPALASHRYEVSFIGSAYWNRVAIFDQLAPYLARRRSYICGIWWDRLKAYSQLSSSIALNKWMSAEETSLYYNGTKIVINLHRATDDDTFNHNSRLISAVSPNPRTFEIAACGTLQLTDIRHDIARFYKPGEEIVTYGSAEELLQKLDYYLHHEEERRRIALNALKRTMTEHTYATRMAQMLRILFG
ncbi:glycosyltransferase [Paenibacillus sp. YYML68]|uniref:CgeB family protein n=1 Tax=Paenibacillus sp. YYML68 TaxID=2909250 RepID=UPI0024934BAB|nr:glycosyltransferase [Paenibacillus sp. YYML68]